MIDQSLIQSGFDAEINFNNRYIRYLLLTSIETGDFPLNLSVPVETNGLPLNLEINIYVPEDYERNYDVNPAAPVPNVDATSLAISILFDDPLDADLKISIVADIAANGQSYGKQNIDMLTTFALKVDTDEDGNQTNATILIELIDVTGNIINAAVTAFGVSKEELLEKMKSQFDRSIPLGIVGDGQNVQKVTMQKIAEDADHDSVIALYVNLKLKSGPEDDGFLNDRGDIANAKNFLPSGDDIAFGMAGTIYENISTDAFERTAKETAKGSGEFTHPLHKDPNDANSDVIGKIKSISIYPQETTDGVFTNVLVIEVHGEIIWDVEILGVDIAPDPDFWVYIYLKPVINNGILDWQASYDLEFDPVFKFLINLVLATIVGLLFGGGAGLIAGSILFLLLFVLEETVIEPLVINSLMSGSNSLVDASFFDAIPNRLTVETKRWDPFYKTNHQIVAKTEGIQINSDGMAFSGSVILDKQPQFVDHVVIRNEFRNADGIIEKLWYRVKDFGNYENDFVAEYSASDRLPFEKVQNDIEDDLYALTLAEVADRLDQLKILSRILYRAKKVHIVHNQVDHILGIAQQEINETATALKKNFKDQTESQIRSDLGDSLKDDAITELTAELGQAPTDEQISDRVDQKISDLADDALDDYVRNELPGDLANRIETLLRFDLPPEEMAGFQARKILLLNSFEIIYRMGKPYYRDRPDSYKPDNLMELSHYIPKAG